MTGSMRRLEGKQYNGYLRRRVPHELDDVVSALVDDYRTGAPSVRKQLRDQLNPTVASVLSVYGERMATLAVRRNSAEALKRGLVAMGLADPLLDPRDNLRVLATADHSATLIGGSLAALLQDLSGEIPEVTLAHFTEFAARDPADRSLRAMGYGTEGTGDSFRYVSASTAR